MTVTIPEETTGIREIVVRDDGGPLSFRGETVVDLSWSYDAAYGRGHNRWTDIMLYRVHEEDSPYTYAVQIIGRSALYHRVGGSCHLGVVETVRSLRQDKKRYQGLVACEISSCSPVDLEDMSGADTVAVEQNFYTLYRCKDAKEVVDLMYTRTGQNGMSKLSVKLLEAASHVDSDIAAAMIRTRRL